MLCAVKNARAVQGSLFGAIDLLDDRHFMFLFARMRHVRHNFRNKASSPVPAGPAAGAVAEQFTNQMRYLHCKNFQKNPCPKCGQAAFLPVVPEHFEGQMLWLWAYLF